jgi:hypothetical protein
MAYLWDASEAAAMLAQRRELLRAAQRASAETNTNPIERQVADFLKDLERVNNVSTHAAKTQRTIRTDQKECFLGH